MFIEAAGHFIQKQHARTGEKFARQARALLLPAAKRADTLIEPVGQIHAACRSLDCCFLLLNGRIRRQAKSRRIVERLPQSEVLVQHVLLRYKGDIRF